MSDILHHEQYDSLSCLESFSNLSQQLEIICDIQGKYGTRVNVESFLEIGGDRYYRLNDHKVMTWLINKVNRLYEQFDDLQTFANYKAREFISLSVSEKRIGRLELVLNIIQEYVPSKWILLLKKEFKYKYYFCSVKSLFSINADNRKPNITYFMDNMIKRPNSSHESQQKAKKVI